MFVLCLDHMSPDPKEESKAEDPKAVPPSEKVANAHASGDGALERSEKQLDAGLDEDGTLRPEDQDHTPY
jgi:hypothetical protein